MTTKNRPMTPPREKSFFRANAAFQLDETDNGLLYSSDILNDYKNELGLNQTRNVTVMDMRIRSDIRRAGTTTFTQIWDFCFGIAWVMKQVANTTVLPDPQNQGTRETRWIHKWDQSVLNDTVAQDRPGDNRFGDPLYIARTKNMAKQPTANHDLLLVLKASFTANTADQDVLAGVIVEGMLAIN